MGEKGGSASDSDAGSIRQKVRMVLDSYRYAVQREPQNLTEADMEGILRAMLDYRDESVPGAMASFSEMPPGEHREEPSDIITIGLASFDGEISPRDLAECYVDLYERSYAGRGKGNDPDHLGLYRERVIEAISEMVPGGEVLFPSLIIDSMIDLSERCDVYTASGFGSPIADGLLDLLGVHRTAPLPSDSEVEYPHPFGCDAVVLQVPDDRLSDSDKIVRWSMDSVRDGGTLILVSPNRPNPMLSKPVLDYLRSFRIECQSMISPARYGATDPVFLIRIVKERIAGAVRLRQESIKGTGTVVRETSVDQHDFVWNSIDGSHQDSERAQYLELDSRGERSDILQTILENLTVDILSGLWHEQQKLKRAGVQQIVAPARQVR
jgi:hypothetical protein